MKKKIIQKILLIVALVVVGAGTVMSYISGQTRPVFYTLTYPDLPKERYRIAQVSDLHNADVNDKLIPMLRLVAPDMIAITGDLIDSRRTDVEQALSFIEEAVQIAPCYYVTGNHEARLEEYADLKEGLLEAGVTVLENAVVEVDGITVVGINDPSFYTDYLLGEEDVVMATQLERLNIQEEDFTILLSHRPEMFESYVENKLDLVLAGHTHGGIVGLPAIEGFFLSKINDSGEYIAELFEENGTKMVVSRGIGNSIVPFRLNNPSELVVIDLTNA